MKRPAFLPILAAAALAVASAAAADTTGPTLRITSPEEGVTLASDSVDITATYASQGRAGVARVELVVDEVVVTRLGIDPPQASGKVLFTWVASRYVDGAHQIAVRAVDTEGKAGEVSIPVLLQRARSAVMRGGAPALRIAVPQHGATVSGKTAIRVDAARPEVIRYVIFLVDDVFKAMSNVQPFSYLWDTTRYLNGIHHVQAKAYTADGGTALTDRVEVRVDNPGGATRMQTATQPVAAGPPARAGSPALPPPMHASSPTPESTVLGVSEAEVALPGTAPFVSPTGDLVRPPSSSSTEGGAKPEPLKVAALPDAVAGASGAAGAAPTERTRAEADRPLVTQTFTEAEAVPTSRPATAPTHVAAPPEPPTPPRTTPAAPAASAPVVATSPEAAAASAMPQAQVQVAALPAPAPGLPPARSTATAGPESTALLVTGAEAASSKPAPRGEMRVAPPPTPEKRVAMLPARPAEVRPTPKVTAEPSPASKETFYVVKPGDWLWAIAEAHRVSPRDLMQANHIADPSVIHPGQRLRIPSTEVYFDQQPLGSDVATTVEEGRAMVSLRAVVEKVGGSVTWLPETRQASALARNHDILVTIGSDEAKVDGGARVMPAPALLRLSRTVVPLRFLGDVLDLALQYQDGVIHIASGR